mmetsp:Transcript_110042/g.164697  ORF Transcript_110042/g.164697 Transcript_110042/m.164697 type:complete len:95 (+) Transcript_110042:554-838(+)
MRNYLPNHVAGPDRPKAASRFVPSIWEYSFRHKRRVFELVVSKAFAVSCCYDDYGYDRSAACCIRLLLVAVVGVVDIVAAVVDFVADVVAVPLN